MSIVRRIVLLTTVSVLGVALLAPLAAYSAAIDPAPEGVDRPLLTHAGPAPDAGMQRSSLTGRTVAFEPVAAAEALHDTAVPTPGAAPMEATLHSLATPPPAPPTAPAPRPVTYSGDSVWDDLARCESGGNWSINTGNGYYGGLQFSYGTWHSYGGGEFAEYPHQASRDEQIVVAERLRDARGYAPWPACRAKLGLP